MNYVKTENDQVVAYPYSINDLVTDNPNTSFPQNMEDSLLAVWGVFPVTVQDYPQVNEIYKEVSASAPVKVGESWVQEWTVSDRSQDEIDQKLQEKRQDMSVTMRQARLALLERNFLNRIADSINLIPEPDRTKIQIEWEYGSTIDRASVWVSILQPALGLTDEQMDELFEFAATL